MTFTLGRRLEGPVTSEAQGQEERLHTLECNVDQGEEEHGADDIGGKGHF